MVRFVLKYASERALLDGAADFIDRLADMANAGENRAKTKQEMKFYEGRKQAFKEAAHFLRTVKTEKVAE